MKLDLPPPPTRRPGFLGALRHALDGLVWATAHQRNMKIHVAAALLVGCVGSGVPLGVAEKVSLIFSVLLVFFAEIMNSAIEALVDLHTERFHELAKVAKDTAAAGVLVLSVGAVAIFGVVLAADWPVIAAHPAEVLRQLAAGLPAVACGTLLTWKRPRPRAVDVVLFAAALALFALMATWTASVVFSALVLALLLLQGAAALSLRWSAWALTSPDASRPPSHPAGRAPGDST